VFSVREDLLLLRSFSPVQGLKVLVGVSKADYFSIEGQIYNITIKP